MTKLLLAATFLGAASFATPAAARDWWVIDWNTYSCRDAKTYSTHNPDEFRRDLQAAGKIVDVHVYKDKDGSVREVLILVRGSGVLNWFTTPADCQLALAQGKKQGAIPDENDLQ